MIRIRSVFALVVVSLLFSLSSPLPWGASAAAASAPVLKTDCQKFTQPLEWSYCVSRTEGSSNPDILYYFHGLGGDETRWAKDDGENTAIRNEWANHGFQAPTVVAISFGPVWLLAEKNASPVSGLFEATVGYILPAIEKGLGGLKGKRLLFGISMGGFNASQLLLKQPQLFARVVLGCPAVPTLSPFASQEEIDAYLLRTGADPRRISDSIRLARGFFADEAAWNKSSPLVLAAAGALGKNTPPIHISCGRSDEYGFFEGAAAFAQLASVRSAGEVSWQALNGGHCTVDPTAIAGFLSK